MLMKPLDSRDQKLIRSIDNCNVYANTGLSERTQVLHKILECSFSRTFGFIFFLLFIIFLYACNDELFVYSCQTLKNGCKGKSCFIRNKLIIV